MYSLARDTLKWSSLKQLLVNLEPTSAEFMIISATDGKRDSVTSCLICVCPAAASYGPE